ncbi:hypothetical protein FACS1894211_00210 [Clostridia bacterium]|nr:hypothetical protein FACS1894211_00210 [Clostridia bacterium]
MKNIKRKHLCCIVLAVLFFGGTIAFGPGFSEKKSVYAGMTGSNIVGSSLFGSDKISNSDWNYMENQGIQIVKRSSNQRVVKFGGTLDDGGYFYDIGNPLVSTKRAVVESGTDSLRAEFSLKIVKIDGGKRFGFVFGLSMLAGDAGDAGSYFLYFKNDGGYKYGLSGFAAGGAEVQIIAPVSLASVGVNTGFIADDFDVEITAAASGRLEVKIKGAAVYSGSLPDADFSGYIGFTQDGEYSTQYKMINAELSALNVYNSYYHRPATPEIVIENFDTNDFDSNLWWLDDFRDGIFVDDNKLMFHRSDESNKFASRYVYSNFELTYTMSDFQNWPEADANARGGIRAAAAWSAVSFGFNPGPRLSITLGEVTRVGYFVYFDGPINWVTGARSAPTRIVVIDNGTASSYNLPSKFDFLNWQNGNEEIHVKFTVIDGGFAVALKLDGEAMYTDIYTQAFPGGLTPDGRVYFWAGGNTRTREIAQYSEFSIDDITIKNMDSNPNIVSAGERVSSKLPPSTDYAYTDTWRDSDSFPQVVKDDGLGAGGCKSSSAAALVAILGLTIIIAKRGIRK